MLQEAVYILTALAAVAMAGFVLFRQKGSAVRWWLGAGLAVLAAKQLASLWAHGSPVPSQILWSQELRLLFLALLPAPWLAFSLSYGRVDASAVLRRWAPALVLASAAPLILALVPWGEFHQGLPFPIPSESGDEAVRSGSSTGWILPLGTRGYLFHVCLILTSTLIVANLERTLRASIGRVRWQIKFALLGIGGYFAVQIYVHAETVLYRAWTWEKVALDAWVLLVALALTAVSLRRGRTLQLDLYLSQAALRSSITLFVVGAYLLGVGVGVHVLQALGLSGEYRQVVVFLAVLAAVVVLLSDRAQQDLKRITLRHFRRPTHDYRRIWTRFSQGTEDKSTEAEVGRSVVAVVAEALDSLAVSLWMWDPGRRAFRPVASTTPTEGLSIEGLAELVEQAEGVVEVGSSEERGGRSEERGVSVHERGAPEDMKGSGRPDVPLAARRHFLGRSEEGDAGGIEDVGGSGTSGSGIQNSEFGIRNGARDEAVPPSHSDPGRRTPDAVPSLLTPRSSLLAPDSPLNPPPLTPAATRGAPDPNFGTTRVDYLVPLRVRDELVGVLALGDRVRGKPLGYEDRELLEVLAEQTAAILTRIRLARRLREASEMEAFQSMSAFFIHDLKNLANRLSLTVQNLPRHYDKPEFREEALRTIGQSVEKIQEMCARLSPLREKLELHPDAADLAELTRRVAEELRPQVGDVLTVDLRLVPPVRLDAAQFRKVLVNLVLNAWEAVGEFRVPSSQFPVPSSESEGRLRSEERGAMSEEEGGVHSDALRRTPDTGPRILLATRKEAEWVVLEVADNGPGIPREFMEERLFHPFQTTKKQGMGIGLYQSKMIVEAHGGRIEVESAEGEGTVFRVLLPAAERGAPATA